VDLAPADPVDLGAQSNLIGAPEHTSTEAVLAVPNGGYVRGAVPVVAFTDPQMSQTRDSSRAEYLCDTAVLQERTDLPRV